MKKVLLVFLGLTLFLSSCEEKPMETTDKFYNRSEPKIATPFTYNEHDYIMFEWGITGYDYGVGYVHDPECRKCKNNK